MVSGRTKYSCAAILVRRRDHQTQIWFSGFRGEDLNVIFYQNMPNLHNQYKSAERKISTKKTKIVSDSPALHSRWLLLLKLEISSIVHCCFSISQNELKFKLQLHGKE
jgi:hypothetical protein